MTDDFLTLVPPAAERGVPHRGEVGDILDDIDRALSHGPPGDPWRGCLFTLRRLLVEQAGASPLRSVDDWSAEDR